MSKKIAEHKNIHVVFQGYDCYLTQAQYTNNRVALELVDFKSGMPIARATVNAPEVSLRPDEILIKDWSENAGMLQALEKAGVVRRTGESVHNGFIEIPKCQLLNEEILQTRFSRVQDKSHEPKGGRNHGLEP